MWAVRRTLGRVKKWLIGTVVGAGALVIAGGATAAAVVGNTPAPEPTVAVQTQAPVVTPTPTSTPVVTPAPVEVAVPVPEPVQEVVPEPEPAPVEPVYCPEGTVAGGVDDYGNEFNCYTLNDGGEVCGGYNDANECILWYKP